MACPDRDDLVGHALGALEPDREREVARHAEDCERCSRELRRLAPAVGVLAESVEQVDPPPSLRERVLGVVREEAGRPASAPSPRRGRLRGFLWRPAAALGAIALLAAGAVGYLAHDGGDNGRSGEDFAMRSSIEGASGSLEVEGDGATLRARGMPQLAEGAVYQVWVAGGDGVRPSAAFVPHADGSATAAVPEAAAGATQVMVTKEPRAGMGAPHSAPVLSARLD